MNFKLIIQIILVIILFVTIIFVIRRIQSNKKVKRISCYALDPMKDHNVPLWDKAVKLYYDVVKKLRFYVKKVYAFKVISKRYEKYIKYKDRNKIMAIDYITYKLLIALAFILLTILSQVFVSKSFSFFGYIINFIIGYYLLDIYLIINYKKQTKLIREELLRAVIIMNNAFKAGNSTLQAISIASKELPEPINDEFKKMYLDMKYGLSVDKVFERFAKRVDLEEAVYLSSSLTILNKTGGDITQVFSSIERTLFDKKKLDEELKNISASPTMVVKVLFVIPIVFVLIIYILNPNYFSPLFSGVLGYMIISIIMVMFIIYALLLRRILKVEVQK